MGAEAASSATASVTAMVLLVARVDGEIARHAVGSAGSAG